MIGYFIIQSFERTKDSANAEIMARVKSDMDSSIEGFLYLPPYLRKNQCNITKGSVVFGVLDDISGFGAAICGLNDADYKYFLNADLSIKKTLTVDDDIKANSNIIASKNIYSTTGNISAQAGDVIAGTISLSNHIHIVNTVSALDAVAIVEAAANMSVATTAMTTGVPL